jgi:hypothetical protein
MTGTVRASWVVAAIGHARSSKIETKNAIARITASPSGDDCGLTETAA